MSRKTCISKTAKNAYFGSKSVIFGPKVLIFWKGAKVLVPIFQKTTRSYCFWSGMAPNGPQKPVLGQKCQFFCLGNPIFVNGTLVALCVTTIARIGPIKISLFVSICRAWCSVFFSENLNPVTLWDSVCQAAHGLDKTSKMEHS